MDERDNDGNIVIHELKYSCTQLISLGRPSEFIVCSGQGIRFNLNYLYKPLKLLRFLLIGKL